MTITGRPHHGGNATKHCEQLRADAENWPETEQLALLFRLLSNPQQRARLLELAERVEAEDLAAVDVLTG